MCVCVKIKMYSLSIQMNFNGWVEVDNLSEFVVKDAKQARELYEIGSQARSTACTNSNRVSSRSHWCATS